MQLKRLLITLLALALFLGVVVYKTITYLPAAASPVTTVLPQKTEEQPQFLFALGNGQKDRLKQPVSVVAGDDGRIYVTDAGDRDVKIFLPNGRLDRSFGSQGRGQAVLGYPYGIGLLKNGDIVVSDSLNLDVKVFSGQGKFIKLLLDAKQKIRPGAITIDNQGQIYISDLINHQVVVLDANGKITRKIKPAVAPLKYPQEIVINPVTKNLWVADSGNFAVKEINPQGKIAATISGWGEPPQNFSLVRGMSIDNLGRLIIADTINGTIHVMSPQGRDFFSFNGQGAAAGKFVFPSFVYIDKAGKIYVADRGSGVIQVWGFKKV